MDLFDVQKTDLPSMLILIRSLLFASITQKAFTGELAPLIGVEN